MRLDLYPIEFKTALFLKSKYYIKKMHQLNISIGAIIRLYFVNLLFQSVLT